jgi:transmembrane protein EpsG
LILTYFIYCSLLFFTTITLYLSSLCKVTNLKRALIFSSFISILIISSIRSELVGTDNLAYAEWYSEMDINSDLLELISINIIDFEPGFVLINYVFKVLDFSYNVALLFYAFFIWAPIFSFYKYFNKSFYFVIFTLFTLGYLFFSFNGQRQAIAIGFMFFAIRYLFEGRTFLYILFILLACTFHFSAILLFSLFFINKIPKLRSYFWYLAVTVALFFPLNFLFNIIGKVASLFPFYASYLLLDNFTQTNSFSLGVFYQVILEFIILYTYKVYANSDFEIKMYNIFFIGAITYNLFYGNLFLSRIVVYFLYFQAFVFAIIFSKFLKSKMYIECFLLVLLFTIMFLYKIQFSDSNCSPYFTVIG